MATQIQKIASFLLLTLPALSWGAFITVGPDTIPGLRGLGLQSEGALRSLQHTGMLRPNTVQVLEVDDRELPLIGNYIHHHFNRCAGYIYHETYEEALKAQEQSEHNFSLFFTDYSINQERLVESLIDQVDEFQIRSTIIKLSSFRNRRYDTPEGVNAARWLAEYWKELSSHRSDIVVEFFEHDGWPQPSVIATIPGETDEVVIVGGHLDSISWRIPGFIKNTHAPGADDNASGIATFTEALRILSQNGHTPQKTLVFMAYAAEEVGLRGSREIAQYYRDNQINVTGVMQLDMTNFHGSDTIINLVDDYTNKEQNAFLGQLVDEYLKVPWGYTHCGYACSDHASWTNQGFAASAPFESTKQTMNRHIHTKRDILKLSGGHALHAVHFAKLVLAYLVELDQ